MKANKLEVFSILFTCALLNVVLLTATVLGQTITTPTEILQDPDKYDGKMVQVVGKVMAANFRTSKNGDTYAVLRVADSKVGTVSVFVLGSPPIKEGDTVRVRGRFQKVKHVSPSFTFYNEIDASKGTIERIK